MARALNEMNFEALLDDQSFNDLADSYTQARVFNETLDFLSEWGSQQIQDQDRRMEEGEASMSPFNRMFFTYHNPGSDADGTNEANVRYWENNDDMTEFYHEPFRQRERQIEALQGQIQDEINTFDDVLERIDSDDLRMNIQEHLDMMLGESMGEVMGDPSDYAYWTGEMRTTLNHPDYDFMLRELTDQGRLNATDDVDYANPEPSMFSPAEGEESLYNEIFNINGEGGTIEGFSTDAERMENFIENGAFSLNTLQNSFADFAEQYAFGEEGIAQIGEDDVDREEDVEPDRDVEGDIITPLVYDRAAVGEAMRSRGVDIIDVNTGTTRRQLDMRLPPGY